LGRFDIEQEAVELSGFRMYAVEKWYVWCRSTCYSLSTVINYFHLIDRVVERSKFMKVVVVYTGEAKDVVSIPWWCTIFLE
jgi:hypothetical protein